MISTEPAVQSAVLDSKCDYPAACNAMETLLIHRSLHNTLAFQDLLDALRGSNVVLHPGPRLARYLPVHSGVVSNLRSEYGGLECSVEVVDSVVQAAEHINSHGSSHTDAIITENGELWREYAVDLSDSVLKVVCFGEDNNVGGV